MADKFCGQVNIPTVNEDAIACANFYNTDCVIYQDPIPYFALTDPSTSTEVFNLIISSLQDARNRIVTLEGATGISFDLVPTDGSTNAVQSNGIFDALALKLEDAPSDGTQYTRQNGAWAPVAGGASNVLVGDNTAVATTPLPALSSGTENTAFGDRALENASTINGVVAIGDMAGFYSATTESPTEGVTTELTVATDGIFIGVEAKPSANNSSGEIVIGARAHGNGSNTITIGGFTNLETYLRGDVVIEAAGGSGSLDVAGQAFLNSGVNVTGNISVSGTVDGRDVATDGTKLDGIEAGATADQSAAEVPVADIAGNFTAVEVEGVLAELATAIAAGIADGDKGDITVSGSGAVWTIDNTAVSFAKIQDVTTGVFTGRISSGSGPIEELSGAQATTLLSPFSTSTTTQGVVPGSNNLDSTYFLDATGNWTQPPGASGANQLNELSDVNTSTPTNRNALMADGTDWESRPIIEADISDLQSYVTTNTAQTVTGGKTFSGGVQVTDEAYGVSWNGSLEVPTKNAVYDEVELKMPITGGVFSGDISVPDDAYGVGWNGSLEVPTKNAIYDQIESITSPLAGQGVVDDAGTFKLGGTISELRTTTVSGATGIIYYSGGAVDTGFIAMNGDPAPTFGHVEIGIRDGSAFLKTGFRFFGDTSQTVFDDIANSKGIEYAADYSANFTARSLVDKQYVDDAIVGGGGASQLSDLTDVNTSIATNRNVLVADGIDWESRALVEADISDLGSYVTINTNQTVTGTKTFSQIVTGNNGLTLTAGNHRIDGGHLSLLSSSSGFIRFAGLSSASTADGTYPIFYVNNAEEFGFSKTNSASRALLNLDSITTTRTYTFPDKSGTFAMLSDVGGGGATVLSDLTDVNTSTPTNRNVLVADGVDWESRALVEADLPDLSGTYVTIAGVQTITGTKTFTQTITGEALILNQTLTSTGNADVLSGVLTSGNNSNSGTLRLWPSTIVPAYTGAATNAIIGAIDNASTINGFLFTPTGSANTATFNFNSLTADRQYDFPDAGGTVVLTGDLPDNTDYVDLTSAQNIGGIKSFTSNTASTTKDTGAVVITLGGLGVEGAINAGGDITAFASSDPRLKDDMLRIKDPMAKLRLLTGYTFTWNDKQELYHGDDIGLKSTEVAEVIPSAVREGTHGYQQVDYKRVTPLMVEAIKEQQDEINQLRMKNKALDDKVENLSKTVEFLMRKMTENQ